MDRHTQNRAQRTVQMTDSPPSLVPKPMAPQEGIPFETALTFIKLGYKAQRAGWNGKNMWVEVIRLWSVAPPAKPSGEQLPFIAFKTASGDSVPWSPSNTDILAHDWAIVDDAGIEIVHGVGATPLGNQ